MAAKRFFYVCAGLLCLALAYHLGATKAGAQSSVTIEGANAGYGSGWATGVVGRTFHFKRHNSSEAGGTVPDPVPGTSPVIATASASGAGGAQWVMLENGDVYSYLTDAPWVYYGNLLGGSTPAQQETWGAMKSRHRGERGSAQPGGR